MEIPDNKRACKREPSGLVVKFSFDGAACRGIIKNVSERGMCIETGSCPPCESTVKLKIESGKDHIEIPVKVRRKEKADRFYDIMGVEFLKPNKKIMQLLSNVNVLSEAD
ncbi:MAG: PilZ domain-containing protein [Nitrospirota bacterium]